MKNSVFALIMLLPLLFNSNIAHAQQQTNNGAKVLVLGTFHFANPGLDVVKTEVSDVLSSVKQKEIEEIVKRLTEFKPTRIAVELLPKYSSWLDSTYSEFMLGNHELSRNETQQIGFRLASQFEHPRIFPIDHTGEFPFEDVMAYAQKHNPEFVQEMVTTLKKIEEESNLWQREKSILEILQLENEPERIAFGHSHYVNIARVGAGDTNVGADLLAKWYERNIHIVSNIQSIAGENDRILVIIGAGHLAILRELINADPKMQWIEANDYLK